MSRICDLSGMVFPLPEREVLLRLGCNLHKAELETFQQNELKKQMLRAFSLCRPRGRYTVLRIQENTGEKLICEEGFTVESAVFANQTGHAPYLWIAGGTAGGEITAFPEPLSMAVKAVYDAVGSESADAVMDFLQRYAAQNLKKNGLDLAERRFSPGYGDMSLTHQKQIFSLLRLEELDLTLNSHNMIIPEKSVTAMAPVWKENSK